MPSRRKAADSAASEPVPASAASASGVKDMNLVDSMRLRFAPVPRLLAPPGAAPTEVSAHQMDRSYTLETMLNGVFGGSACWNIQVKFDVV